MCPLHAQHLGGLDTGQKSNSPNLLTGAIDKHSCGGSYEQT